MFCSQCGRKLREGMLFCPFCGAEIVIPDQDEPQAVTIPGEDAAAESASPRAASGPAPGMPEYGTAKAADPEEARHPGDDASVENMGARAARRRARLSALPAMKARVTAENGDATPEAQTADHSVELFPQPEAADAARRDATEEASASSAGQRIYDVPEDTWRDVPPEQPVDAGAVGNMPSAADAPAETDPAQRAMIEEQPDEAARDAGFSGEADDGRWSAPRTEPAPVETERDRRGVSGPVDWRSAFDDWLEDVPEEAPAARQSARSEERRGIVTPPAPDRPRHRPAEGEAVPVHHRTASAGKRRGAPRRQSAEPARPGRASLSGGASRDTVVPRKRADDDLFMDSAAPVVRDAYDDYVDGETFEEERPSFFFRHLRSMVGLILLAVLAFIIGVYAVSAPGQTNLAKLNLAWQPEVYSRLGKESYNVGRFQQAGAYYEQALKRDPGNYSYASSAAKCYLDGKNTARAAEMLKKCIALMPTAEDPYVYLLGLYPDPVDRPLEVAQLLQQGYQMTGSERLRDAAAGGA